MQTNNLNTELEEQHLAAVKDNYLKLQAEIKLWQREQAPGAVAEFQLASASPFFTFG